MKTKLFIIILLLFTHCTKAQSYYPLVDTNKVWSTLTEWLYGAYDSYFTKFTSDTIINTFHYKKVLATYDSTQINWTNNGYIREDSTKKVFYKEVAASADGLLYDFNIGLNDTVTVTFPSPCSFRVDTIDSINVSGKQRKRFHLSSVQHTWIKDIWIEGIGSILGVLSSGSYCVMDRDDYLLCFTENDTLKYINPYHYPCYYTDEGIKGYNNIPIDIQVFPNPATNNITIETPQQAIIEITNIQGQLLQTLATTGNKTNIDASALAKGMYFVKVKTEKGVAVKKFVKE